MSEPVPVCKHWIFGNITVQEREGLVKYERAILVTFKDMDDFRAAMRFLDPIFSSASNTAKEQAK